MSQPNIVFILIDDLGWRDLCCYGSDFYETPNLDRLAAQGMRFTDAYASCPVSSPTRASLMSGKYPARVGVTQYIGGHAVGKLQDVPYHHNLPLSEISIATALRRGAPGAPGAPGYQTWHVGKWHLGDQATPRHHGFDVNLGGCGWGHPRHGYFSPYQCPTLSDGPPGEYLTDRLTDEAIKLIQERDQARPFFLNFWHYAVHTPIQSPPDLVRKYEEKTRRLGLDQQQAIVEGEYFPCQHKRTKRIERRIIQSDAKYAAMMENLDMNIGRLLDALDQAGLADDTLVVFKSDNGGLSSAEGSPTCNLPLAEGKGWMYEGGTRVCQMARWPGRIKAGAICTTPTTSTDWYPTLLEAAGLPMMPQQHVDGVSLMPLLEGHELERGAIYWHYPHYGNQGGTPGASVRDGDWKLIEFFEDGHLELYNLREDEEEKHNRAATEPELTRRLLEQLHRWRREVEALIPKPNPNYVPPPPLPAEVDAAHV
ncbi:MAG: sulfatase [Phycisphaeraceae bacterium]